MAVPVGLPPGDGRARSAGQRKAMTAARVTLAAGTIALRVLLLIPVAFFVLLFIVASLGAVFASGPW